MAPRTYTRSQRPSQSQSQPRQSQRGHKSRIESDEEEEDQNYNGGNDMDVDEDEGGSGSNEISRKANQLVRLALFNENRRGPLRRDDISKKVMGGNARIFNRVFEQANATLKKTFGMELVELPSKASLEEEATGTVEDAELEEARKAVGGKKKATTVGSKQYIIRSILDPGLLDYASLMHESILNQEAEDLPSDDDDDDSGIRSYGSIFSWSTCDQLEAYGVLTVILSLILVSGKVMSDADLRNALKHLYLNNSSQIRFTALSTTRTMPLDRFLDSLMRQGYIDQQIVGEAKKKGGPGKRARQADDDTGVQYEWRWGPRAHSEFGEQGIAQFIAETMVSENQDDDDEEEGSSRGQRRRQEQAMSNLEKMLKGVQKAAGGILSDLK